VHAASTFVNATPLSRSSESFLRATFQVDCLYFEFLSTAFPQFILKSEKIPLDTNVLI
jgi:hypothetical protein